MLRVIRSDYNKTELNKIAKLIQFNCKFNMAETYRIVFSYITKHRYFNHEQQFELLGMIDNSLAGNTKIFDSERAEKIMKEAKVSESFTEFKQIKSLIRFRLPAIKNIVNELNSIISELGGFNIHDNILTVEQGPYILEGFDFGKFQISLNIISLCKDTNYIPSIKPVTPQYPKGNDDEKIFSHPHVELNHICIGAGKGPIRAALKEFRVLDVFTVVDSVLSTLSNDPYRKIESWIGYQCGECGDYYNPNDVAECKMCGRSYCNSCVRVCCVMSINMCFGCDTRKFSCQHCGSKMCSECILVCTKCKGNHCITDNAFHRCV